MRVKAFVATTRGVPKYSQFELTREALEGMAAALRGGTIPMLWNHDVTQPLEARIVTASVVELDDGHHAVEVEFETDPKTWEKVRARFEAAGVVGGMSFRATAPQDYPASGREPLVVLAADAAAWTDEDRSAAGAFLDAAVPTRVDLLFEYNAEEIATVALFLIGNVGLAMLGNAAYDAVKRLIVGRSSATRIEIRRGETDGAPGFEAVVVTNDPEVAQEALEQLTTLNPERQLRYDTRHGKWLEASDLEEDED